MARAVLQTPGREHFFLWSAAVVTIEVMSIAAYEPPAPHLHHAVQFYEDEDFLVGRIADFLAEGMRAGEPCIVIATAEHNRSVAERLIASGFDADAVHFLDARTTMDRFLDRGVPDARKFQR